MPRILIADDHVFMRRRVRDLLESEKGWEVCAEAANGLEAVALTGATRPDIVVLDLSMPEMDGLQAAQQIRAQFPATIMIILTGHDPDDLMEVWQACGVRACLSKTDMYQLTEVIDSIWQQAQTSSNDTAAVAARGVAHNKV